MSFPIVLVTWDDATELDGWKQDAEELKPCLITSVGYLVHQSKDYIVLAQDLAHDGYKNGRSQIPRGIVKQIKVLKKKNA